MLLLAGRWWQKQTVDRPSQEACSLFCGYVLGGGGKESPATFHRVALLIPCFFKASELPAKYGNALDVREV